MKKVAIIGGGFSRVEAPFKDSSWKFWGLNDRYVEGVEWDRWFEIHSFSICSVNKKLTRKGLMMFRGKTIEQYLSQLEDLKVPVYMQETCMILSNAIAYPEVEIVERFGRVFTNTISWMIALAIYEGYDIGLFGVDMVRDYELEGRVSVAYLIGVARGLGLEVTIAESCPLLKVDKLYGFER